MEAAAFRCASPLTALHEVCVTSAPRRRAADSARPLRHHCEVFRRKNSMGTRPKHHPSPSLHTRMTQHFSAVEEDIDEDRASSFPSQVLESTGTVTTGSHRRRQRSSIQARPSPSPQGHTQPRGPPVGRTDQPSRLRVSDSYSPLFIHALHQLHGGGRHQQLTRTRLSGTADGARSGGHSVGNERYKPRNTLFDVVMTSTCQERTNIKSRV